MFQEDQLHRMTLFSNPRFVKALRSGIAGRLLKRCTAEVGYTDELEVFIGRE